ncbi:thiamine-phosphate kinase [Desulfobulbus sp.]|uniref:thiamine-phosphate kinase n=1 Tax=Desulfobulbus sp. TaxID=895 RepID=UPI00286F5E64|nr:thiamine-phosphate kinase [Desulfobulbus sp.]
MNERQIIDHIAALTDQKDARLIKGIGDDCAVVAKDGRLVWLLTMDTVIEGVHFDLAFHPPEQLGRKVVSVNVSDIGAMGGRPVFALLSIGMPKTFDPAWFQAFARGLTDGCREYGCLLIGGDTVASPQGFNCTLTVIGEAVAERVIYRSGARPGDTVWVSGPLGLAAAGLELLRRQLDGAGDGFAPLLARHLDPTARVDLGRRLGESGLVHAMMDLSDGLATDLAHLCKQSGVGARIAAWELPLLPALVEAARLVGADPEQWAIGGGEDYELLFTAPAEARDRLLELGRQCGLAPTPVGTVVEREGVVLLRRRADGTCEERGIAYQGFDHFRERTGD